MTPLVMTCTLFDLISRFHNDAAVTDCAPPARRAALLSRSTASLPPQGSMHSCRTPPQMGWTRSGARRCSSCPPHRRTRNAAPRAQWWACTHLQPIRQQLQLQLTPPPCSPCPPRIRWTAWSSSTATATPWPTSPTRESTPHSAPGPTKCEQQHTCSPPPLATAFASSPPQVRASPLLETMVKFPRPRLRCARWHSADAHRRRAKKLHQ